MFFCAYILIQTYNLFVNMSKKTFDNFKDLINKTDLINLFNYLKFDLDAQLSNYLVFTKNSENYIVIFTDCGFRYYKSQRPELKLTAIDIIEEVVSKIENKDNLSVFEKSMKIFEQFYSLETNQDISKNIKLDTVALDFNHFIEILNEYKTGHNELYDSVVEDEIFDKKIFMDDNNNVVFPLFNKSNVVSGLIVDDNNILKPILYTNSGFGIYFSNPQRKTKHIFIFSNPKEVFAFHNIFKIKDVIYIASNEMSYETTKIISDICRHLNIKKPLLTFSGSSKISSYIQDIRYISYLESDNFSLNVLENNILIKFQSDKEKAFKKLYENIKMYNESSVIKSYKETYSIIDQKKINNWLIKLDKDENKIKLSIPLDVNALKLIVGTISEYYYKNQLELIKPRLTTWYDEYQKYRLQKTEIKFEKYKMVV